MPNPTKEFFGLFIGILSNVFISVFGQIIPNAVGGFFREIASAIILILAIGFAFTWFLKARPHNKIGRAHV